MSKKQKTDSKETALAPRPVSEYAIMRLESDELKSLIEDNLGNMDIEAGDLDRITVPSGGATKWTVAKVSGEEQVGHLTGVIAGFLDQRVYYEKAFEDSPGDEPPDCISFDLQVGEGNPGGQCASCPHAQWGSAERGAGQKCRLQRILFLIQPESLLPICIKIPPGSLANARRWFLRLSQEGKRHTHVIAQLALESVPRKGNPNLKYSRVVLRSIGELSEGEAERFREIGRQLVPQMTRIARRAEETQEPA